MTNQRISPLNVAGRTVAHCFLQGVLRTAGLGEEKPARRTIDGSETFPPHVSMPKYISHVSIGLSLVLSIAACGGAMNLAIQGKKPVSDQSVPTPQKVQYAAVMVLPPKGSERGEVSELANLEKALLKRGIRVISSGVTGRVVVDNAEGKKNEGAKDLTDLERALVLARKSGADALLQVIRMEWRGNERNYRYFRADERRTFTELASKAEYEALPPRRGWVVSGPSFEFEAKIIDVESGEIVTAVDISQSTVREIEVKVLQGVHPDGIHNIEIVTPELKTDATGDVMEQLATLIAKGKAREARGPSPQEMAMEAEKKKLDEEKKKVEAERARLEEDKKKQDEEAAKKAEEAKKGDDAKKGEANKNGAKKK
jgi:hypothetical protein